QAHVGTTYKRALETNFSGLTAPFQPVPATLQHCGRRSTIIVPSTAYGDDGESRDEALHLLAETSFSIPLPEPDVQVSKHPALYAWALARLWVGLRYV
ncbi:MAG: hypothetical protein E6447_04835, partial [Bradyrhizobium sp.]|nr:hypothetical protein [Bradyrhizobium sp.]